MKSLFALSKQNRLIYMIFFTGNRLLADQAENSEGKKNAPYGRKEHFNINA
jgi:hypothetical protein